MPNHLEKIEIPLKKLIGGASFNLCAYRLTGKGPGPQVHIQSSVHGAEVQGNAVIYKLMQYFTQHDFKGSITFIPHANPMSANAKAGTYTQGRFSVSTGENWNRIYTDISSDQLFKPSEKMSPIKFKSYLVETITKIYDREKRAGLSLEKKLGLVLQKLAAPADIVLDLHTGPVATRYLYVGEYAQEKSTDLPFPHRIIIPNEFAGAMDEATFMPWLCALNSLEVVKEHNIPFESYTVELGSEEVINLSKAEQDRDMILNLLAKRGMIDTCPQTQWPMPITAKLENYKSYYAPKTGLYEYLKSPGQFVKKGEALYKILDFSNLKSSYDLENCLQTHVAYEDSIVINHNPSASVHEGTVLYQLLTDYF